MTFQSYLNKRHNIIDKCDRGILTEAERDSMLDKIDEGNQEYFEAAIEIGKLNCMIERTYDDHKNGKISLGQRENVVNTIKDRISIITESVDVSFDDRYQNMISINDKDDVTIAKECVDYLYENSYIMESEANDLYDIIDYDFTTENIDDTLDNIMDEIMCEGTNLDIRRTFKQNMNEINKRMHTLKKLISSKKFAEAHKELSSIRALYVKLIDDIKNIGEDSTIGSDILGFWWWNICRGCRYTLVTLIPVVGIAAAIVLNIRDIIAQIIEVINDIKSHKGEITPAQFNLYKNKLIIILKRKLAVLKKVEKTLDDAEKNSRAIDEVMKTGSSESEE